MMQREIGDLSESEVEQAALVQAHAVVSVLVDVAILGVPTIAWDLEFEDLRLLCDKVTARQRWLSRWEDDGGAVVMP